MKKLLNFITTLAIVSLILAPLRLTAAADTPSYPELVSGATDTFSGNGKAVGMSKDGRYFLLSTTNAFYLRDQQLGTTTLVPIGSFTSYSTSNYQLPQMSGDGSHLLFYTQKKYVDPKSSSPTLQNVFLENLFTNSVINVSSTIQSLLPGASLAGNVYFSDDGNNLIFSVLQNSSRLSVYDLNLPLNTIQSIAFSTQSTIAYSAIGISGDAKYVFYKDGPNVSTGNLWKYDTQTNQAIQILPASYGASKISISTDGHYVGFLADAINVEGQTATNCNYAVTGGVCPLYYREDTVNNALQRVTALADSSLPSQYDPEGDFFSIMSGDGNTFLWSTSSIMRSNNTYHAFGQIYSKNMTTGVVHDISVNALDVPADSGTLSFFLTGDGSEASISLAAPDFGGPLDCTANSDVNPNRPVPCVNNYMVSTSPADIVDNTSPTVSSVTWSQNPVPVYGYAPKLVINYSDTGSGNALGEYFIGDADPGVGNATPLQYDVASGTLYMYAYDAVQTPGTYNIHYRVYDNVGNWSQTYTTQLTVLSNVQAPEGLSALSPTKTSPILTWTAATNATSYNIYRDGVLIGTTSNTTYTDTSASEGNHNYSVSTLSSSTESSQSNAITIILDKTRPVMSFTSPISFSTTFTTGPTVSVSATDSGTGLSIIAIHVYTSTNQLLTTCGTATPTQLATGTMSCSLANLPNGIYYIKAGSFDGAGNNQTINSGNFTIQN